MQYEAAHLQHSDVKANVIKSYQSHHKQQVMTHAVHLENFISWILLRNAGIGFPHEFTQLATFNKRSVSAPVLVD